MNPNGRPLRGPYSCEKHPLYRAWAQMRARCNRQSHKDYKNYGGRGIAVCSRWSDFWQFVADMGERPSGASLDRIDNNGPYSPENCRWATKAEQMRNMRKSKLATLNGETLCLADWAKKLGIHPGTLHEYAARHGGLQAAIERKHAGLGDGRARRWSPQ